MNVQSLSSQVRFLLSSIIFLACVACDVDRNSGKQAVQEMSTQVEQLSKTVSEYVKQAEIPAELRKLQQFEYQVIEFPESKSSEEIQSRLNELGRERWDCFEVERREIQNAPGELRAFCKRRPDTPLKYVPKNFIGG